MPFTEIELRYIENTVGKMCKRRARLHLPNKYRIVFEVKRLDVIVHEETYWQDSTGRSSLSVAKFKYNRRNNTWKLYWMMRDGKWHLYDVGMPDGTERLELLVREVEADPYGAFFG
jgi:hypothetical protein